MAGLRGVDLSLQVFNFFLDPSLAPRTLRAAAFFSGLLQRKSRRHCHLPHLANHGPRLAAINSTPSTVLCSPSMHAHPAHLAGHMMGQTVLDGTLPHSSPSAGI